MTKQNLCDNDTYNGWSNWATWNVNLWLGNSERYYFARIDVEKSIEQWTAETAESFVRTLLPKGTADMIMHSTRLDGLDDVNYEELAEVWNAQ